MANQLQSQSSTGGLQGTAMVEGQRDGKVMCLFRVTVGTCKM